MLRFQYLRGKIAVMNTFFDKAKMAPLAERMRPVVLSEFIGQKHIVSAGSLLHRAILSNGVGSCIFWGPPGCGKTTLANILANSTDCHFEKLNAVLSGVKDAKRIIEESVSRYEVSGKRTYLLLDECHRWSKAQSDCVLQAIEKGYIIFIGSTTENPYASMTPAIVSRCRVFEFYSLNNDDVKEGVLKALTSPKGFKGVDIELTEEGLDQIVSISAGDLRNAYNALELAVNSTPPNEKGKIVITKEIAADSCQKKAMSIDSQNYYDMISAFIKSMRGSDPDAALFWFSRLVDAGCDPMLLARRIVIHAAEDVGLADPTALNIAVSAMKAYQNIGLPEGRIPLAEAILYISRAKKSNSTVVALGKASELARNNPKARVPFHLMDSNLPRETANRAGNDYKYPHDYGGYIDQQYLPDELKDVKIYIPNKNDK